MISLRFLKRVVTLPWVIVATVVRYYTTGTVHLNTHVEFQNSLYKNLHLAVECHLANNFSRLDVARYVYTPVSALVDGFRPHPLAQVPHYGAKLNANTFWIAKNTGASAVLFLHGGGYCLNVFAAQFVGIMALYQAVPAAARDKLSVAVIDYSLTCHNHIYPTQIHEAVAAYRAMVAEGYSNITIVGDSAGTNLACAVARYIAYPDEAAAQFTPYTEFAWDFSALPQPHLVFISPWLEPYTVPTATPGVNTDGDLGAIDTQMGDWYVEGLDRAKLAPWVKFTDTDYDSQWAQVAAFNGTRRTLLIYGEREILRNGVERFVDIVKGGSKMDVYMEPGGIHDGMLYVESLDYLGKGGAQLALNGEFKDKYAYSLVGQFLLEVVE